MSFTLNNWFDDKQHPTKPKNGGLLDLDIDEIADSINKDDIVNQITEAVGKAIGIPALGKVIGNIVKWLDGIESVPSSTIDNHNSMPAKRCRFRYLLHM